MYIMYMYSTCVCLYQLYVTLQASLKAPPAELHSPGTDPERNHSGGHHLQDPPPCRGSKGGRERWRGE